VKVCVSFVYMLINAAALKFNPREILGVRRCEAGSTLGFEYSGT
jgi:hypothetical protein